MTFSKVFLFAALAFSCSFYGATPPMARNAAARSNNVGVALMSQQLPGRALAKFEEAQREDPSSSIPQINKGIALIYLRRLPEAEQALATASKTDSENPRVWYSLGLAQLDGGNPAAALISFERASALDPMDADTYYYVGTAKLALKQYDRAVAAFEKALELNPLHASAQYGLARALQRSGKTDDARKRFARFQRITQDKIGTIFSDNYAEQGRLATAEDMLAPSALVQRMIPVIFSPFTTKHAHGIKTSAGACMLDVEANGGSELVSMQNGANAIQAYRFAKTGAPEPVDMHTMGLTVPGNGVACAVGDYDNDGRPDLAVALEERIILFHNLGHGKFTDVTAAAGIRSLNHPQGLTFVDFDHDGDLDLFITGSDAERGRGANVLWRNNGNGSFTEWTGPTGLAGSGYTISAVLSDINNDRAVDLVVTGHENAPSIYENQREGSFKRMALYSERLPATRGVSILDFNHDAWMDVAITHAGAPGLTLWRSAKGRKFERVLLPLRGVTGAWGVTPIDFDNDGWVDLAVLVETPHGERVRVLRNCGPAGFKDVTTLLKIENVDASGARALIAVDADGDGAADLILPRGGADPIVLYNRGGNRNHSLRMTLTGLADNKMALGTKVEVLADGVLQKFEVAGSSGYLSQGPDSLLVGLGPAEQVDVVRMLWPTGVPQDEINIVAGKPLQLKELDRRGSSCPVLFAWDGSEYRFVSDVIGAAVVGHWISPSGTNDSDSDEWIKVDGSMLKPHNGLLSLRFGEPMEEVNYIDQLRLVAIDHPENVEVYPDERFLSEKPFASGQPVVASSKTRALAGAWDDRGEDALPLLAHIDHRYVQDFNILAYAGFANPHTLTLDLGPWVPQQPVKLFLHGYVDYFSASSMYAAWQAGLRPEPPSLQAQLPDGTWKTIIDDMGFPSGLPRTIVVDLSGKLPPGVRRVRIRTNLQVYWDQIQVDNGPDLERTVRATELPLSAARLAFRGYPKQIEGTAPGDLTYDYQQISQTGPFFWPRGSYTRFGTVTPLLSIIDNQYVIFGSGEEIDAQFSDSSLLPIPPHWKRDYFFYADGFVKDMDFYEAMPFTVAQLPFRDMKGYPYPRTEHFPRDARSVSYQLDWNERFESGDRIQHSDFDYKPTEFEP